MFPFVFSPSVCPEQSCGEAFSKEDVRTDKGCLKEIQSLTVTCSGAENGCEWRGKINELEVSTCNSSCNSIILSYDST